MSVHERLEPESREFFGINEAAQVSIAVSLKRLADTADEIRDSLGEISKSLAGVSGCIGVHEYGRPGGVSFFRTADMGR